ncbi:MAG: cell division protein FtsQ/DivIB [Gammaproteobacteria bacterium]
MVAEAMTFVRRVQPRHWLRWMLAACAVVLAWALIAHYAVRPSGPLVNAVVIHLPANHEVNAAQIRSAVASVVHGGVLAVDLGTVRAAVQELPWVAGASVRRVWPAALAVDVRLRRPIARWGENSLVDSSGQVFTPASVTAFTALPVLKGMPDEASEVFADFARVQSQVRPLGLKVRELSENARGELNVTFASGLVLALGHKDPFGRLARFIHIAVPTFGSDLTRVATVDMRYPNGFAVGWKGEGDHGSKK